MVSPQGKIEFFKMISANIRKDLNPDDYELGEPEAMPTGLNTKIVIRPYHSSKLYTNRVLRYQRGDLAGPYMTIVQRGSATQLYHLLDQINADPIFQINQRANPNKDIVSVPGIITPDDVFNVELPSQGARPYLDIPMRAKPTSLFLIGALHVRILRNQ